MPPYCILPHHFWCKKRTLQGLNLHTRFGGSLLNSHEIIISPLRNPIRWWQPPFWISVNMHFRRHRCVPNRSRHISTKFGDHWSNSECIANVFWNTRCRWPPIWILVTSHVWRHRVKKCLKHSKTVFEPTCTKIYLLITPDTWLGVL